MKNPFATTRLEVARAPYKQTDCSTVSEHQQKTDRFRLIVYVYSLFHRTHYLSTVGCDVSGHVETLASGGLKIDPQGVCNRIPLIGCIARKIVAGVTSVQDDNAVPSARQIHRVK